MASSVTQVKVDPLRPVLGYPAHRMKRALLVGINLYAQPGNDLAGCVNDTLDLGEYLVEGGWKEREIRMLHDRRATTEAIEERLRWLVHGTKAGDLLFFGYSGHGAQIATRNRKDELDGLDEVLCPTDFDWESKKISDDTLRVIFSKVPKGVRCVWHIDACHSGGLLDRAIPRARDARAIKAKSMTPPPDIAWRNRAALREEVPVSSISSAKAVLLAACRSNETAADIPGMKSRHAHGAFTGALLDVMRAAQASGRAGKTSLAAVHEQVLEVLRKERLTQQPVMRGPRALTEAVPFMQAG